VEPKHWSQEHQWVLQPTARQQPIARTLYVVGHRSGITELIRANTPGQAVQTAEMIYGTEDPIETVKEAE
jgi:hypothetical protein